MGAYKYIQKSLQSARKVRNTSYRARLIKWRKEVTVVDMEKPTNIPSARKYGYKATKGFVITRVKMKKGNRKRPKTAGGRSSRHSYRYIQPGSSHRMVAEQKANRKHRNCEVLGSYSIADDGQYEYFEVILADREHNSSKSPTTTRKGRAFRGLTSAGQKARKRLKSKKTSKKKAKKRKVKTLKSRYNSRK